MCTQNHITFLLQRLCFSPLSPLSCSLLGLLHANAGSYSVGHACKNPCLWLILQVVSLSVIGQALCVCAHTQRDEHTQIQSSLHNLDNFPLWPWGCRCRLGAGIRSEAPHFGHLWGIECHLYSDGILVVVGSCIPSVYTCLASINIEHKDSWFTLIYHTAFSSSISYTRTLHVLVLMWSWYTRTGEKGLKAHVTWGCFPRSDWGPHTSQFWEVIPLTL